MNTKNEKKKGLKTQFTHERELSVHVQFVTGALSRVSLKNTHLQPTYDISEADSACKGEMDHRIFLKEMYF